MLFPGRIVADQALPRFAQALGRIGGVKRRAHGLSCCASCGRALGEDRGGLRRIEFEVAFDAAPPAGFDCMMTMAHCRH